MPDTGDLIVLLVVIGARLLVPLAIPRYPIPAGIAALVIDAVDQTVFQTFTKLNLAGYQGYDTGQSHLAEQDREQVGVVPTGFEALGLDTHLGCRLLAQQVER